MIDTVVLQIDLSKSKISIREDAYNMWTPSLIGVLCPPFDNRKGMRKFVNNPTERDKKNWGYLPYLTCYVDTRRNDLRETLYIQFSAPKLIFGNNFSEVGDSDFNMLCDRLYKKLYQRGIYVPSASYLSECDVKAIHYCKNIVYTDGTTPSSIIRLMHKSNISYHKNTNESKYKNGGESCHFYTLGECFCAYDKRKELRRSKLSKRGRVENDDDYSQMRLFDETPIHEPFQVLRLEHRLEGKKAINRNLVKNGIVSPSPTFKDLYDSSISKCILTNKMREIDNNIPSVAKCTQDIVSFMECLHVLNPGASFPLKLKAVAARAILNEAGVRDFRKAIGATDKQWFDFVNDLSKVKIPVRSFVGFDEVYRQLESFTPVKLENYIDKMSDIDI